MHDSLLDRDDFYRDRSCSTNSYRSVDDECDSFIEEARDIRKKLVQSTKPQLKIFKYRHNVITPRKATIGWILYTLPEFSCTIPVNQSRLIPLGIAFSFPKGYFGQLQSRPGLAFQHGVYVQGGTIEPDYDGDIYVLLHNFGKRPFQVYPNVRICQLVLLRYENTIQEITEVSDSKLLRS